MYVKAFNGNFKARMVVKPLEGQATNFDSSQIHGQFLQQVVTV